MFLTTFKPFTNDQAFNITTVLANHSFIYLITPENPSISTPIRPITDFINWEQNLFVYITTKRYMSKEFYSIIINIGASKKSTAGYRQYLIYKNTIADNIDINTTQIRAVNI
jgi:hypothetical protein